MKAKFNVGQVVMMKSLKKPRPFMILEKFLDSGEWYYRWDRKNASAEHMIRKLTTDEIYGNKEGTLTDDVPPEVIGMVQEPRHRVNRGSK